MLGTQQKATLKNLALVLLALALAVISVTLVVTDGTDRGEDAPVAVEEKGTFRVLVSATDRTSGLCDVMMLLSLDRDAGTLGVLQIPRDTYGDFGRASYRKLNGASSYLEPDGMRRFLESALGLTIDRYVQLSPDGFRRMVDALGGVEIELQEDMVYHDPYQDLSIRLEKGRQTLSGEQAEWFVRYRSDYVRGDLGRMDAQKIFLTALAQKVMATRSPIRLVRLAHSLLAEAETDIGFSDLCTLCEDVMALSSEDIFFLTAPGGDVTGKDGGSYYVLSAPAMNEVLSNYFGGGSFDVEQVFLHPSDEHFRRVYEQKAEYQIFRADRIAEEGIEIPTRG